HKKLLQLLT
nr:Chain B, RAC3 derived peptide [synthetic construct]